MRALAVFSGGLDSMLAVELIRAQGLDVVGVFFETPFFTSSRARRSAEVLRLSLKIIDLSEPHLELVKNPPHGYGGHMNPCIDCHTLMLRKAGQSLLELDARFMITGEVLGQRPMSQNLRALSTVAAQSGYRELILRPLSAKLLPATLPEEKGWVNREKLMAVSGRSRKPQMELAKRFRISDYPSPAGGCLLTDPSFSRRLKDLFSFQPKCRLREIELLKLGRHFRVSPGTKIVVGRNKEENDAILALRDDSDLLVKVDSIPGPVVLVVGETSQEIENLAAVAAVSYSDAEEGETAEVLLFADGSERRGSARSGPKSEFQAFIV